MSDDAEKPNWDTDLRAELVQLKRDHGSISPQVTDFLKRFGEKLGPENKDDALSALKPETLLGLTRLYKDNLYPLSDKTDLSAHLTPARNMLHRLHYSEIFYERALVQGLAAKTLFHVMRVDDTVWQKMGRGGRIAHLNKIATALNSFMIHEGHIERDVYDRTNNIVSEKSASHGNADLNSEVQAEFNPPDGQIYYGFEDDVDSTADQINSYNSLAHEMTHRLAAQTIIQPDDIQISNTANGMLNLFKINAMEMQTDQHHINAYAIYQAKPEERIAHFVGGDMMTNSIYHVAPENIMLVRDVLATSDVPHVEVVEKCTAALRALSKPSAPKPKI